MEAREGVQPCHHLDFEGFVNLPQMCTTSYLCLWGSRGAGSVLTCDSLCMWGSRGARSVLTCDSSHISSNAP